MEVDLPRPSSCILVGFGLAATLLLLLAACATPEPVLSPLPLPTRFPPTPTATPVDVTAYFEDGRTYRATGDTVAALAAFSETIALQPDFAPAYVERGKIYRQQGNPSAALDDAQRALTIDPDYAAAHVLIGEVLRLDYNDPRQALIAYDRAAALDPSLTEAIFPARWRAAEALNNGQRMIALANLHEEGAPDDPLVPYYQGRALSALGNYSAAIRTLIDALEGQEEGAAALWFALGKAYGAQNAWEHALPCLEQAAALTQGGDTSMAQLSDTYLVNLFAALGEAYLYTNRCADAQTLLNGALALAPERSELHTLIGRAIICQTPTPTPTPYPWTIGR
jgi:tetratricopeptide (TPR) repeat protein